MARESKRLREIREKIEPGKAYPIDEAFALLKQFATAKFDESVEVAVNLGVDTRKSDQVVRGATVLPRGTGKQVRVAVFAQGANAENARAAGAAVGGFDDLAALDGHIDPAQGVHRCAAAAVGFGQAGKADGNTIVVVFGHLSLQSHQLDRRARRRESPARWPRHKRSM